jgi:ribosomal protein S18 acetylase RimI-like enzyme
MRGYRSAADLEGVGRLVRRAWAERPGWNAWTFARWDIWSGWRLADELLHGVSAWRDHLALWEEDGEIVAAAFIGESPRDGVILCDPGHAGLAPELLGWVEQRCAAPALRVEVRASSRELVAAVAGRGYGRDRDGHDIPREKPLHPERDEPAVLPAGLRIAELEDDELARYNVAVQAVSGRVGGSPEEHAVVRRCPSAVRELGLVVLDADAAVVGFAEAWLDRDNLVAEFEPVGTIPSEQRCGIGSAVMQEAENRLRRLGCRLATVHSWSAMEGANRLYESLGYKGVDRQEVWWAPDR